MIGEFCRLHGGLRHLTERKMRVGVSKERSRSGWTVAPNYLEFFRFTHAAKFHRSENHIHCSNKSLVN